MMAPVTCEETEHRKVTLLRNTELLKSGAVVQIQEIWVGIEIVNHYGNNSENEWL